MTKTNEEKAIEIQEVKPIQAEVNIESLMSQAIDKNVPVDVMERLLAIRRELKQERAKEAYDRAMAAFQASCPTIKKTKQVKTDRGIVAYRYAPIESIVEQVKEQLRDNGFSYSTNMELLENGVKVSVKVTHEAGHSEITDMTVPLGNKTNVMSQTQVVAAAQTFAKRYAFCNAFGILSGDEDDDANSVPKGENRSYATQNKPQVVEKQALALITSEQKMDILKRLIPAGRNQAWLDRVVKSRGKELLKDLNYQEAEAIIQKLDQIIEDTKKVVPEAPLSVDVDGAEEGIEAMKKEQQAA